MKRNKEIGKERIAKVMKVLAGRKLTIEERKELKRFWKEGNWNTVK